MMKQEGDTQDDCRAQARPCPPNSRSRVLLRLLLLRSRVLTIISSEGPLGPSARA